MAAYYNEFDKPTAAWLRELIKAGLIADGDVDERSIKDVEATDLAGYQRCHFFAGIAGWELALQLAAWPDDREIWTGSCPCQPYSIAGKQLGDADERNLWPEFHRLIRACRPREVLGEQVVSLAWWDTVAGDLERDGYATWPQIRRSIVQRRRRLFWSASLDGARVERLVTSKNLGVYGPWGWRGQEDLRAIASAPFVDGDRWPQPIVRALDDGLPRSRVGILRGAGNAIDPHVAAEFIAAYMA